MLAAFCRATGIPPAACAMIGDSTHDLDSGRAAGMVTVAVLTGLATRDDLEPHADVVLDDIAALPGWLGICDRAPPPSSGRTAARSLTRALLPPLRPRCTGALRSWLGPAGRPGSQRGLSAPPSRLAVWTWRKLRPKATATGSDTGSGPPALLGPL